MEMAFGKIAICLMFVPGLWPAELLVGRASRPARTGQEARATTFPVRHEHLRKGCAGTLTVDDTGIRFTGAKKHAWVWKYADIQRLTLEPGRLHILTYKDGSKLRLGADVAYTFTGTIPVDLLYPQWRARLDERFVAAVGRQAEVAGEPAIPAKLVGFVKGSEGTLTFAPDSVIYASPSRDARTWRYSDIRDVSSAGPFDLTITTFEKQFHFQLKQAMPEQRYNQLWLDIEKRNGRIQ
jgi:hypothetical protein